jgi:hypothetical protein
VLCVCVQGRAACDDIKDCAATTQPPITLTNHKHPYNSISNSKFTLNGRDYTLLANEGKNSVHGGTARLSTPKWAAAARAADGRSAAFTATQADGDGGCGMPAGLCWLFGSFRAALSSSLLALRCVGNPLCWLNICPTPVSAL